MAGTPTYTARQYIGALVGAGFSGSALEREAAIGLRESGGAPRPNELNPNAGTGDFSLGPWQENYIGSLGTSRMAKYGAPELILTDVNAAARAAWDTSSGGTDFSPWTTNAGLPQSYLSEADQLIADVQGNLPAADVPIGGGSAAPTSGATIQGSVMGQSTLAWLQEWYQQHGINWTPPAGAVGAPATDATLTAYVPGTDLHIPGTGSGSSLLPSWAPNPANIAKGAAGDVASGVTSALATVARPLFRTVSSFALIGMGLIFVLVGLVVIAHSSGRDITSIIPSGQGSEDEPDHPATETGGEGAAGEAAEGAEAAAAAA